MNHANLEISFRFVAHTFSSYLSQIKANFMGGSVETVGIIKRFFSPLALRLHFY